MNEHLAVISQCVLAGAIAVLVLDKAGWHISPRVNLPDNIALLPLPSYAPELKISGNSCVPIGSAIVCGRATRPSSMPAVRPGTS
jgi:hypothetical protein